MFFNILQYLILDTLMRHFKIFAGLFNFLPSLLHPCIGIIDGILIFG